MDNRVTVALPGTAPIPLSRYLKGLGLLRIVAEQCDPLARGWWERDRFHLESTLDGNGLARFLLEEYRPTPVVAPWNGGSGFYGRDDALKTIRVSKTPRLEHYRQTIETAEALLREMGLRRQPQKEEKAALLQACRNRFPDEAVPWIDAAIVITGDGLRFPPLVGTGGTDGNLEFTNNFMQRLLDVIDPESGKPTPAAAVWLQAALWGESAPGLVKGAIGQFSPGEVGGPNASSGFEGDSLVNPWDFVLMIEGVLLYAAAASKRLESRATAGLSYPFTVRPVGVGNGSTAESDEEKARPEMWMPLWRRPATYREIAYLFHEGRAHVTTRGWFRPAADGVDFARACATLAVDRGIESFQRYSFFMRSGKAYLAVPTTRFVVRRQAHAELLEELDDWLERLRRVSAEGPNTLQTAVRNAEEAVFNFCRYGGERRMQAVLTAVGTVEKFLARAPKVREMVRYPLWLNNPKWFEAADDGSEEFRLAASFVSLRPGRLGPIRSFLSPVDPEKPGEWSKDPDPPRVVWTEGPLADNLARVLRRLLVENRMREKGEKKGEERRDKSLAGGVSVPLSTVMRFLRGELSDAKIAALIWGLSPLATEASRLGRRGPEPLEADVEAIPWVYALSKLILTPDTDLGEACGLPEVRLPVPDRLLSLLQAGRV
ncbi:MAG: type I-U CRISPR-associated protein Csx17, partial [Alicyclobacillaceae bacterium]|nr:type I-U CRISPR-associated protein Csx17 [Alicyclobacillaceae bacterium]